MTERLVNNIRTTANSYMNDAFRTMLEYHIPRLSLVSSGATTIDFVPALAHQFSGDLYGLLSNVGIETKYHWAIMRCNGWVSPTEYDERHLTIIYPPTSEIDELHSIWVSNNNLG